VLQDRPTQWRIYIAQGSVQAGNSKVAPTAAELRDQSDWRRPKCARTRRTITEESAIASPKYPLITKTSQWVSRRSCGPSTL